VRLRLYSIIGFLLGAIGTVNYPATLSKVQSSTIQSNEAPTILSARFKGRKLILTGERFMEGAVILLDGEPQKTRNDDLSPSTTLIGKKAGDRIPDYAVVTLQVQSSNGLTDKFPFFKGQVITLEDLGKPILLRVGERFLLSLRTLGVEFKPSVFDPTVLVKVTDAEIQGSQGVFEALRVGTTKLEAVGELPCGKATPPCLSPSLHVEFTVIVE